MRRARDHTVRRWWFVSIHRLIAERIAGRLDRDRAPLPLARRSDRGRAGPEAVRRPRTLGHSRSIRRRRTRSIRRRRGAGPGVGRSDGTMPGLDGVPCPASSDDLSWLTTLLTVRNRFNDILPTAGSNTSRIL